MGDSNQVGLYYIEEVTWGTTPGTPTLATIRHTGESLGLNYSSIQTAEIRADRQVTDLIRSGLNAAGGFNFELSYGAFDDFMEGALWGDWVGVGGTTTEFITSGTTSTHGFLINSTAKTICVGSSQTIDIEPGQWVRLEGSDENDGYLFVTAVQTTTKVLTVQQTLVAEIELLAVDAAILRGARLRNGTTEHAYSIERKHELGVTDVYFRFLGMVVNTFNISVSANAILTGDIGFIGKTGTYGAATVASATSAAAANDIMEAITDVGDIMEGSTLTELSSVFIRDLRVSLNNNVRGKPAIGTLGNADVGVGEFNVTGSMSIYFANSAMYAKLANNTDSGISFKTEDGSTEGSGNAYVWTMPRVKFSSDAINASGSNQDVMENIAYQAIRHASYNYTLQVCRFAAL